MANTDHRSTTEPPALESLPFLNGLRKSFRSVAEMVTVRAKEIPDRLHVSHYQRRFTFAQTNRKANRVAHFLKDKGVRKGDIVSIMVLNAPEIYDAMFGAQKIGAVAGLINFALKGPEIAYVLDHSRPKVVFVGSDFMADFARGFDLADHKPIVVEVQTETVYNENPAQTTLSDILGRYPDDETLVDQAPDDPFLMLYSSGTTGRPKGILISNRNQLSVCEDMARLGLVQGNDAMLILLPMFHTNPICVWTFPMIFCGQTVCIRKAFSPADFWPAIIENGITIVMGVPAMYNYVYYSIDPSAIDRSQLKLRWAFCGAAPLSVDLINGFAERFGVDIIEGYGLTEGTGIATVNPPRGRRKIGSVGLPLSQQRIAILDEALAGLPPDTPGEICIKGPCVMLGYLNDAQATDEALQDGWLRTGDIGMMDAEGYFYIVDRKKDMINRGGENIYPKEIEMVLEAHPRIVAAAVIGVPDKALGERVKAVLEVSAPGTISQEAVKQYLSDKLARYKIPEFIEFVDRLPRNPTGKILKKELRKASASAPAA
jgi:long-chain acyl-CoA synthetase